MAGERVDREPGVDDDGGNAAADGHDGYERWRPNGTERDFSKKGVMLNIAVTEYRARGTAM